MSVGEVCNRNVVIVDRQSSIEEAARLMREHHVGDLVVVEKQDERTTPVGILTDRDIVVAFDALRLKLDDFVVEDAMGSELVTAFEDDDLLQTVELMRIKGVRRVPVVDRRCALVGILTADDLIEVLAEMLNNLSALITGQGQRERKRRQYNA